MCGIAGIVNLSFDDDTVQKMLSTMLRRGPDERGWFMTDRCCLIHSRLAVIDIENGKQPMHLQWGTEVYTIVYNGELYNTEQIRRRLINLGHIFQGHSDTEVVLHAYAQWREAMLHKLNGIFAFAIWEYHQKSVFLARDRMGVKPLFYKLHEDGLVFSSEIKTILAYPTVQAELDSTGIAEILLLGPGRAPGSGVLCGIYELEPGCYAHYTPEKWTIKRYWKLTDREHTDSFEETAEHVRYLVTDSIQRQMVSDVSIGAFLSGGLDSSLICSVCAKDMRQKGNQLTTFSVDYIDNDKYFTPGKFQPNSDSDYIHRMQSYLGSRHHWSVLSPEELISDLENATLARDLPGMADVDSSLLAFCRQIRQHVTVALSGECADEIFGGYPWYRDPEIRNTEGFPWAQNTKYRAGFLNPETRLKINPQEFVNDLYRTTVHESDILPGTAQEERRMKEMVNLNHRWFMQTLLDRKDRMSMYHGLEVRVPFCDYRIAEYLYGVPWTFKDYQGKEKGLLRYAMRGVLPEEVLYRKKSPYPKTHDPRYLCLVSNMLQELMELNDAPLLQIVDKQALKDLLNAEYTWPWYGQLMRVPQTIAYMLQINTWMKLYQVRLV